MKILTILLLALSFPVFGTTYYVKNGGDNGAAGTSDGTAWATISKVNSVSFSAGDTIKFNRGDSWREYIALSCRSGTSGGRVVYTSYGTGAKPIIYGSKLENSTGDWVDQGDNLWRNSDSEFDVEVCNLIFNNEESAGKREFNIDNVTLQGEWIYDFTNDWITVYSVSNPATFYSNIEVVLKQSSALVAIGTGYVTIDGLDLRYGGRHGIATNGGSNVTIKNCEIRYMGGAITTGTTRIGNGIEFYASASNIIIENNHISQSLDEAITLQSFGSSALTVSNIRVQNNIMVRNDFGFSIYYPGHTGTINGIYFEHNTGYQQGKGWSHSQKFGNLRGSSVYVASLATMTVSNVYFRNNIFSDDLYFAVGSELNPASLTYSIIDWDYNIYDNAVAFRIAFIGQSQTLAQWQTYSSEDANSLNSDPDFVNASADSFQLVLGSPAIGAGVGVGVSYDYDGNLRADPPSIGAYEYDAEEPPPPPPILPNLSAVSIFDLTINSVRFYASVTDDGEAEVTVRGFCYSTSINPTTAGAKTENGTGTGAFEATVSGLDSGTKYYVRGYATNSVGTAYSSNTSFTTYSTGTRSFVSGGKRVIHNNKRVIK